MNKEVKKLLMSIKGETSALLADFTNGLSKNDVVALGYLYGMLDDILLGKIEKQGFSEEDIILSRMYEVYAMVCYSETPCLSQIKTLLSQITEVL